MFKLIQQYRLVGLDRVWYRPRAFGDRQADGTWDGWLVFFPVRRPSHRFESGDNAGDP